MAATTAAEEGLQTLLAQFLSDDATVHEEIPSAVEVLRAGRLVEGACSVEGFVALKRWVARLNVLLHHANSEARCVTCDVLYVCCVYVAVYMCVFVCVCACTCVCMCARRVCVHIHTHTQAHACVDNHTPTHTHTRTHAHTQIHT